MLPWCRANGSSASACSLGDMVWHSTQHLCIHPNAKCGCAHDRCAQGTSWLSQTCTATSKRQHRR